MISIVSLALVVIIAASHTAEGANKSYKLSDVLKEIRQCQVNHKIELKLIMDSFLKSKVPDTENGKCFIACLLKQLDVLNDGQIDQQKMLVVMKNRINNQNSLDQASEIAKRCSDVTTTDKNDCSLAYNFAVCARDTAQDIGFNMPFGK